MGAILSTFQTARDMNNHTLQNFNTNGLPNSKANPLKLALAQEIAEKSSYVLKIGKQAFYRQAEMGLAEAYAYASEVMTENMMARDSEEGICAFIEKRDPSWEDR